MAYSKIDIDDDGHFRCGCCLELWPSDDAVADTLNGWICPDCYQTFRGPDEAARAAAELRERARYSSCPRCGSLRRNNPSCDICRAHLLNTGLSRLLEAVLNRQVTP